LYVSVDPDAEEGHDTDHFIVGDQFVDDPVDATEAEEKEPQAPHEQFVPPHQEPT
jgi:hypothetical protein